jgi:tetratricopeptide (TPR) repeat protein
LQDATVHQLLPQINIQASVADMVFNDPVYLQHGTGATETDGKSTDCASLSHQEGEAIVDEEVPKFEKFVPHVVARAVTTSADVITDDAEITMSFAVPSAVDYSFLPSSAQNDLYAASYMYSRAVSLIADSWSYHKALPLLEECLQVRETLLPTNQLTIETRFELAKCCSELYMWDESANHCRSCVEKQTLVFENEPKDGQQVQLDIQNQLLSVRYKLELAKVLIATGRFYVAEDVLHDVEGTLLESAGGQDALELQSRSRTKQSQFVNGLRAQFTEIAALNCLSTDALMKAKEFAEQCEKIVTSTFGMKGLEITSSYLCSARVLIASGRAVDAKPLIEQALIIRKNKLSIQRGHPKLSECLFALGECLYAQGNLVEADDRFAQAVSAHSGGLQTDGSAHLAYCLLRRANIALQQGSYKDAMTAFQNVRLKFRKIFGEQSLSCAECEVGISLCEVGQYHYVEARAIIQGAIAMQKSCLSGAKLSKENDDKAEVYVHSIVAHSGLILAEIERKLCNFDEALTLYNSVAECYLRVFTKGSMYYARCDEGLANYAADKEEYETASRIYERVLELKRDLVGDDHLEYANTLNAFGCCLCFYRPAIKNSISSTRGLHSVNKKIDKAIALLEEALKIRRIALRDNHPLIAETLSNWGLALAIKAASSSCQGKYKPKVRVRDEDVEDIVLSTRSGEPPDNPQGSLISEGISQESTEVLDGSPLGSVVLAVEKSDSLDANVETGYFDIQYDEDDLPVFPDGLFRLAESKVLEALNTLSLCFPEDAGVTDDKRNIVIINVEGNLGTFSSSLCF